MTKIIDLSVPITAKGHLRANPTITYWDHKTYAEMRMEATGLEPQDLPEWGFCGMESLTLSPHTASHMDAPWHYGPTCEGKPAKTIDRIPLEWCYSDGVLLDFHNFERQRPILVEDLEKALSEIPYQLKPMDIVLIRTDGTKHYPEKDWEDKGAGMVADSTRWLLEQGIKVVGIDSWTWDQPFDVMQSRPRPKNFLESHWLGTEIEYCHMESLTNFDLIPKPVGFKVAAFPIKIEGGSGGWVRAVAIVEDQAEEE